MRRGSLSHDPLRKAACADNPKARHGPYHSLTQAVGGKTRSRFLMDEKTAVAERQIAAGREFFASRSTPIGKLVGSGPMPNWSRNQMPPPERPKKGLRTDTGPGFSQAQGSCGPQVWRCRR
jgi:hypothetical protein